MQVVLSQRMAARSSSSPLSLYRALRSLNPSPYMFYYDFGDFHVVGASPEILVRKEGATVTLRPIAGTRPRGATREADEKLAQELLADPKEIAEHVMLVDLGRNDVGRVAQTGTVQVTDRMVVERYSHVMHIVSNVEGTLKPGLTSIDVLRAAFPAGTVSGAPKVRAMEIIDELEPTRRGVYAGAVGYLSFQDDMDTAIAIRTAVIEGRDALRAGRSRHRSRLGARVRVDRIAEQGARGAARGRHGAAGAGRGGVTMGSPMHKRDRAGGDTGVRLDTPTNAASLLPVCAANLLSRDHILRAYRRYAPVYDRLFGSVLAPGRRALSDAVAGLRPASVLEVGVGTGLTLPGYPPSSSVVGIDISSEMLAKARQRAARLSGRNIRLELMDAEALTFADRSFECVTVPYVLSVTPDPRRLVAEVRRVCRVGGTILILNHFSGGRFWWLLEHAMRPLASRIGFRSDFDLAAEVESYDWNVEWVRDVNFLGLSKLVSIRNG